MSYQKAQLVNGAFQSAFGSPLSNGWLTLTLSHDENVQLPASQVVAGVPVKVALDNNGNCAPSQYVWTADILQPTKSYYTVEAYSAQGLKVWAAPQYWTLAGPGPIDLGAITPSNP
jgi:hypothetical protein